MRNISTLARFSLSASAIAFGAALAAPAYAQTPAPAPAPTPQNCSTIQDEAQRQACANAATQVDPLANSGESSATTGGASADSTQGGKGAIVVTGSRLRRDDRTSADPLTGVDPHVENRPGRL